MNGLTFAFIFNEPILIGMATSSVFGDTIVEHLGLYDIFQRRESFRVVGAFLIRAPQDA